MGEENDIFRSSCLRIGSAYLHAGDIDERPGCEREHKFDKTTRDGCADVRSTAEQLKTGPILRICLAAEKESELTSFRPEELSNSDA